jgi:hypothetical protein
VLHGKRVMIPSPSPLFVFWFVLVAYALPASVLAVLASGLICLILRQHWSVRAAVVDCIFASALMVVSMLVLLFAREGVMGVPSSNLPLALTISTFSVVVKRFIPPALQSSKQ